MCFVEGFHLNPWKFGKQRIVFEEIWFCDGKNGIGGSAMTHDEMPLKYATHCTINDYQ